MDECDQAGSCDKCQVYREQAGDEIQHLAESFDAMTFTLKKTFDQLALSKETLARSESKYKRIFETSMDMIFVADNKGLIQDINPAGRKMLGWDPKAGAHLADLFEDPERFAFFFQRVNSDGYVKDTECRMRRKDGSVLEVLLSSTAHVDAAGRIIGYEGIVKDITLRKNMEQQLLQADKLASIGQLAAGVAHEINNPLGLILGYTQLLIRNSSDASQNLEDLRTIEKQARNCKVIVQALLNFARRTETRKAPSGHPRCLEPGYGCAATPVRSGRSGDSSFILFRHAPIRRRRRKAETSIHEPDYERGPGY